MANPDVGFSHQLVKPDIGVGQKVVEPETLTPVVPDASRVVPLPLRLPRRDS